MGQPLSIENARATYLITTRTSESRLWLINSVELEELMLGILARYVSIYKVQLYAFVIMGNHYHLVAGFPGMNRAPFMRDFNSAVARLIGRMIGIHGRRSVWARRYSFQLLPRAEDVRNWFYYAALNPVSSGITESVQEYSTYNSFADSAYGITRKYRYVDWARYNDKKRFDLDVTIEEFTHHHDLTYVRLPGCEDMDPEKYRADLYSELIERQGILVIDRRSKGKGFLGMRGVRKTPIGAKPLSTKTSRRNSKRPLVLSLCMETLHVCTNEVLGTTRIYKALSKRYRSGELDIEFPPGTYRPSLGLYRGPEFLLAA